MAYKPSKYLESAIDSKDAYSVRGAIAGIIQANPRNEGQEVQEAIRYAEACGIAVFETQRDESLPTILDEAKWNKAYYASAVTYLQENFTKGRLEHVLKVSKKTHPAPVQQIQPPVSTPFTPEASTIYVQSKKATSHQWKKAGIAAAGIVVVALIVILLTLIQGKKS